MENEKKGAFDTASDGYHQTGLTKREYFAGLAMQGICASNGWEQSMDGIVKTSVEMADKLLKELNKNLEK